MSAYSGIYTDLNGLAQLRTRARQQPSAALEEVAGQFEALFTRQMLKTMRESSFGGGVFDSSENQQYLEMFDSQVAVEMSRGRGLGLKQMLIRQLGGTPDAAVSAAEAVARPVWEPTSRTDFVQAMLPFAREVEQRLGIDHRAVVAHAALESGWGRYTMQRPDGSNAFNFFGIKADRNWKGDRVVMNTLEVRNGVAEQEQAGFRAYDSIRESVQDYADFLQQNPRYREALEVGADPHAFAQALQRAGYATDPAYAEKLSQLIDDERLTSAMSRVAWR